MKKLIIVLWALGVVGCVSMEQQCANDTSAGTFQSVPQCMAYRQQENANVAAVLQGASRQIGNTQQQNQTSGRVDYFCQQNCISSGYLLPFCQSKCAY